MGFRLLFTPTAENQLDILESYPSLVSQLKAVRKALGFLETNPWHPGLHTHEYSSLKGARGEKVFEAYAQNHTPGAYRIFWHYGADKNQITIVAITPHP